MSYFAHLFQTLERQPDACCDQLANACADPWPQEAVEELRRAYNDGPSGPSQCREGGY